MRKHNTDIAHVFDSITPSPEAKNRMWNDLCVKADAPDEVPLPDAQSSASTPIASMPYLPVPEPVSAPKRPLRWQLFAFPAAALATAACLLTVLFFQNWKTTTLPAPVGQGQVTTPAIGEIGVPEIYRPETVPYTIYAPDGINTALRSFIVELPNGENPTNGLLAELKKAGVVPETMQVLSFHVTDYSTDTTHGTGADGIVSHTVGPRIGYLNLSEEIEFTTDYVYPPREKDVPLAKLRWASLVNTFFYSQNLTLLYVSVNGETPLYESFSAVFGHQSPYAGFNEQGDALPLPDTQNTYFNFTGKYATDPPDNTSHPSTEKTTAKTWNALWTETTYDPHRTYTSGAYGTTITAYTPRPKNPPTLSKAQENQIKAAWVKKYEDPIPTECTVDNVTIQYYGTYNGYIAFAILFSITQSYMSTGTAKC